MHVPGALDKLHRTIRNASRILRQSLAPTAGAATTLVPGLGVNRRGFKGLTVCGIALVSCTAGSLITARFAQPNQVRADSNRVFELRVYHAVPGKAAALESRFRDTASKLHAKHDLKAVGYWAPDDAPASDNAFIYLLAHPSREAAKENWDALRADPAFQEMGKSEQTEKLVERVDATYMDPTDASPMK
jgi:hypothetical protein